MPRKKKLPLWLVIVLAAVLAVLLIVIVMIVLDKDESVSLQQAQTESATAEPARKLSAESTSLPDPLTLPTIIPHKGVALIMDDVGYDMHALKRILDLSIPVAISVLPGAPFASESASLSQQHGQTVMLHLPMEPLVPKYQKLMTDTFLRADMSEEELRHTFLQDLKKVPYVEGVNNHMGSLLTQLERPMRWVMRVCQEKGLFFIDSRTSSTSVAAELAASMGIAWASRRYFLDHQLNEQAMEQAWNNAMACAEKGLRCIVIAHPHEETISFLEKHLTKANIALMLPVKRLLKSAPLKPEQAPKGKPMEQQL